MNFAFNVYDENATTPVEVALNPALVDVMEQMGQPEWPSTLPGTPV